MSEAAEALAKGLGAALPEKFLTLTEERLTWLAQTLEKAKEFQIAELDRSTEETIQGLPVMLRGPVRKIIGGGK